MFIIPALTRFESAKSIILYLAPKGTEAIDRGKRWEKYDLVTKKKYYHWKRTVTKDDLVKQISAMSGVKVTLVNKDGEEYNSEEYRKNFMRPDPFNPLDLSE